MTDATPAHLPRGNRLTPRSDDRPLNSAGLDDDRLFPVDPTTRDLARDLYGAISSAPIISPHGHVDPRLLLDDAPFVDPVELLISSDHYVTRLLHAGGVDLDVLGVGTGRPADPRAAWHAFVANWKLFAGTASGYWLTDELATLFGVGPGLSTATAEADYDRIARRLADPGFRPRALFERFAIDVLATTDDPLDSLEVHAALAADPAFRGRVLPTFRPDSYLDPDAPDFAVRVELLAASEQVATDDFAGYLQALRSRRAHFIEHGAVSADHGVREPFTVDLDPTDAASLFRGALAGRLSAAEARVFRGHMLFQMARMSVVDGLVMTVHAGIQRNHSRPTFDRFGPDSGHDIPVSTTFTENLRPLLEAFGLERDLHLVLFTVDETTYSREIAPLAGFYPSVYIGAPWWFLDAPDAIRRFRSSVTETAGFYRGSGFVDDTRAFLSIPARHDAARRADAAFLAGLVREGRLDLPTARQIIVDSVDAVPRRAFKL
jgi:glucuronate isomerase